MIIWGKLMGKMWGRKGGGLLKDLTMRELGAKTDKRMERMIHKRPYLERDCLCKHLLKIWVY
jgi:hypothetical protein